MERSSNPGASSSPKNSRLRGTLVSQRSSGCLPTPWRTSKPARRVRSRAMPIDVEVIRKDFPIFETLAHGKPLVYVDSANTSQKPRAVIDRIVRFYETENANIHRGVYELSERATAAYEGARELARRYIGARSTRSIVFTRSTTESINAVRYSWARANVREGDEVLVTEMEHHSNLMPSARGSSSMPLRPLRISRSTSTNSTPTSWRTRRTRCAGRRVREFYTVVRICSRRCRRSS